MMRNLSIINKKTIETLIVIIILKLYNYRKKQYYLY